jgi:hypothetical protein
MQVSAKATQDEAEYAPDFVFTIVNGEQETILDYGTDTHITAKVWRDFIDLAKTGEQADVTYCASNGGCYISAKHKMVSFEVAKYGAGGGSSIVVKVPFQDCHGAFEFVHAVLAEYEMNPDTLVKSLEALKM